jgi:predicted dehydrogenase
MINTKKIKIALIGAGNMAKEYLEILSKNKNVELTSIYSRTFSKSEFLKKKYNIKYNSKSITDLYKITKPNIVLVTVPGNVMLKITLKLINFPWLIFIEKPPGLNFLEFKKLLKISNLKKKKIYVGMNRRYFSSTLKLVEKLKFSKSKRVIQIFDQQNTIQLKKTNRPKKLILNWMYANCIHLIDYMSFLARGEVKDVKFIHKSKNDINCSIIFTSNDIVNYSCIWNKPGPWQVKISTKKFYYELSPLEILNERLENNNKTISYDVSNDDKIFKPGLKLQLEDLINIYKKRKSKLVDLQGMYKTMKLIHTIYKK